MTGTFVVRFLSAGGALIGWARWTVPAESNGSGDAIFLAPDKPYIQADVDGAIERVSVQWTDLGVARMQTCAPTPVKAGDVTEWHSLGPLWRIDHDRDASLPPVTERAAVMIVPPIGGSTATGRTH